MAVFGYARVSTLDQDPDLQHRALEAAGCEEIITEHVSGAAAERPKREALLARLGEGDVLVTWKLDRLSRSVMDLKLTLERIHQAGASYRCLTDPVDTSTAGGRLLLHVLAAVAEFERDIIRERVNAGIAAARERGVRFGRPKSLSAEQRTLALRLVDEGMSYRRVGRSLGVSHATIARVVQEAKESALM